LGRILRGDMGYAMRCKAEEGYGLADVGHLAHRAFHADL
jgi:hypothetical protein